MKKLVCIVIPIYRELTESERFSLQSLESHLGLYDVSFLSFKKWDITISNHFEWKIIKAQHLDSHRSYNRLMYSKQFYQWYKGYEWILIYQLDGLIINSRLQDWIMRDDFDFIGPPGIAYDESGEPQEVKRGFNGGVSLRRTSAFLNVFSQRVIEKVLPDDFNCFRWYRKTRLPFKKWLVKLVFESHSHLNRYYLYRVRGLMEDGYWSYIIRDQVSSFRCAKKGDAMLFCFDRAPRFLFSLAKRLPFSAHAWERWDIHFWKEHLNINISDPKETRL